MKLSVSLLVCSIFICNTIFNVTADDVTEFIGSNDGGACIAQYLKNKGKLANDYPLGEVSSSCSHTVDEDIKFLREFVEHEIKKEFPNDVTCAMEKYEQNEVVDSFMKIFLIKATALQRKDTTEAEIKTQGEAALDEIHTKLVATGDACGLPEVKFLPLFNDVFYAKRPTTATSETA